MPENFILSQEDSDFAEFLGHMGHLDWAQILYLLSTDAKNELKSAVGTLIGETGERQTSHPEEES